MFHCYGYVSFQGVDYHTNQSLADSANIDQTEIHQLIHPSFASSEILQKIS